MSNCNNFYSSSNGFHVLVKPIGPICNLACAYCFYLQTEKLYDSAEAWRMTDETLKKFTYQYIAGHPENAQEINFAWQGGEPTLMGLDFFKRAVQLQKKAAADLGREKIRISNALQTNATLIDSQWSQFLKAEDFLVGVSIDGPEALHNKYRYDRNGKGSFKQVMTALEALKGEGVRYNSLTVVQADNSSHPREVYDFLCENGFEFQQYIPIVEREGENGVSDRSVLPEAFGKFMCGVFDRWLEQGHVGKIFVQTFDMMLGVVMGYPPSLCVHGPVCGRAVAMEHNGDLYSCDHWVKPENKLGNINETAIAEMIDGDFQKGFGLDKYRLLTEYCRQCEFLKFCHGACPKDRIAKAPGGQEGHQYLCRGYKMFYAHSMEVFQKMAACLRSGRPAAQYAEYDNRGNAPQPRSSAASPGKAASGASNHASPGRNDPCPCGSGKKFKRCCGRKI